MRCSGPTPGKNPKKVGDALSVKASRFPWRTKRPPVNWFRMANGPAVVVFTICTPGWSFHEPVRSDGRLIPVCHSTEVWKVSPYKTRRRPPGAVESAITNSWRALDTRSLTWKLFPQFHRPTRSGVWRARSVCLVSANTSRVSPGTSSPAWAAWKGCWLLNENPGDHVMDCVILTGDGVRLTRGKFWLMRFVDRSCER